MQIEINSNELKNALSVLEKGLTKNNLNTLSDKLFFKVEGDILEISVQSDIFIKTSIEATTHNENVSFCLDGKLFIDFAKKTSECISLGITESQVEFKSGKIKATFALVNAVPQETLSNLQILNLPSKIVLNAECFLKATNDTVYCLAKDNARPILQGINFKNNTNTDLIDVCALDGYRLALSHFPNTLDGCSNLDITILGKAINVLNSTITLKNAKEFVFATENNNIAYFIVDNTIIKIPLLGGNFIKYDNILPKNNISKITLPLKDFKEAVDIIQLVSKTNFKNVAILTYNNDSLYLSAKSETSDCEICVEKAEKSICQDMKNGFKIACNAQFLADALKPITADNVTLSFGNENSQPFTIESDNTYAMLLPIRVI